MSTGDPICPTCGNYKLQCICGKALRNLMYQYIMKLKDTEKETEIDTSKVIIVDPLLIKEGHSKPSTTLKKDIEKYLDSKLHAGGLYGLTIHNPGFVRGLIRVIKKHKTEI
jgi:hypothetical protein